MSLVPEDPAVLLTRKGLAAALTAAGFKTAPSSLATMASRGGGPPYQKYGPYPLYQWGPGLAWAKSKLSPVVTTTSELDVIRLKSTVAGGSSSGAEAENAAVSTAARDAVRRPARKVREGSALTSLITG
jgi:hypothetical protein